MKLTKLSLVAALALTATSAFAIENVKVDGQAVFYYQTVDSDAGSNSLFSKDNALNNIGPVNAGTTANVGVTVGVTADLGAGFGAGVRGFYLDTLGLEGNFVGAPQQIADAGDPIGGAGWLGEGYITYTLGNTMIKAGRQELDTPYAFTEKWNVFPTTFDATVIVNKDIQDITLVGAFISESNGHLSMDTFNSVGANAGNLGATRATQIGNGAYMLAGHYTGVANTTINAYAYNLRSFATAYWFDAVTKFAGTDVFEGITAKVAYTNVELDTAGANDTDAFTAELSTKVGNVALSAAYSDVSTGDVGIYNLAGAGIKTKLYTANIFGDGDEAGATDTEAWKVKASGELMGVGVTAQYANYDHGATAGGGMPFGPVAGQDADNFELILKKKVADINLFLAYMYTDNVNFTNRAGESDTIRFIARYNF